MFKFTIRELLLLTLIVALTLGWVVDHFSDWRSRFWRTAATDLAETLKKEGYTVEFHEYEGTFIVGRRERDS